MSKLISFWGMSCLALGFCIFSGNAFAGPQGFGGAYSDDDDYRGNRSQVMTVQEVKRYGRDDYNVVLVGRLTKYLGDDDYVFQDKTGSIVVELDDDDDYHWRNISKNQLIRIYGEADRDDGRMKIEAEWAEPVR